MPAKPVDEKILADIQRHFMDQGIGEIHTSLSEEDINRDFEKIFKEIDKSI